VACLSKVAMCSSSLDWVLMSHSRYSLHHMHVTETQTKNLSLALMLMLIIQHEAQQR